MSEFPAPPDAVPHAAPARPASLRAGLWVLIAAVLAWMAWSTYSRAGWVPLLSGADLGIHELGHLLFLWAPMLVVASAGSALQVLFPLAFAGYFTWRRDFFAVALTLGWAAESLNNVSVYIYDATRLALPLWGDDGTGAGHDWANILTRLGLIARTDSIAYTVRGFSVALFVAAFGVVVWGLARLVLDARRAAALEARRATLPIRVPRNRTREVSDDAR